MRRYLIAAILLLGIPSFGLAVDSPAGAQTPPTVEIASATRIARGAAVDVAVNVTCELAADPAPNAGVSVFITQAVGKRVASGQNGRTFSCSGEPQTLTVRVTAQGSGAPFKKGQAVMLAGLQVCILGVCVFAQDDSVVRIT
jgi:hypothetical protein